MKKIILKAGGHLTQHLSCKILKHMRNTLLLLLITVFQVYAGNSYSQSTKLSLDLKKVTVAKVLEEIEKQSEFYFLFNAKLVDIEREVSVSINNQQISSILDNLFEKTNVDYMVVNRQIILSPKDYISSLKSEARQPRTISGSVTDQNGNPMVGVTVMVKGTTRGTITDVQGNFLLSDVPEDGLLVFSFVGMETQEVEVSGKTNFLIVMTEDVIGLEEVIAIGYGTQKKINLTGAVSYVTSEKLENRPITSVGEGLQGVIPNLNITISTGEPGLAPDFNVRGYESINGGSPLILVDGIAMDINLINPKDIESVTVLKDASASAIYGARAAFGVILVNTKKGTTQKTRFQYDYEFSLSAPIINIKPISNSYDYVRIKNEVSLNTSGTQLFTDEVVAGTRAYYEDPVNNPEWAIINEEFQFLSFVNIIILFLFLISHK